MSATHRKAFDRQNLIKQVREKLESSSRTVSTKPTPIDRIYIYDETLQFDVSFSAKTTFRSA